MSKKPEYSFRAGSRIVGVEPGVAAKELLRIRNRDGKVQPKTLVAESKPAGAPLHPAFEWNNRRAAESWREQQARNVIRSVRVRYADDDHDEPLMVHVGKIRDAEPYYQDARIAAKSVDEATFAIQTFTRKIAELQKALRDFERLIEDTEDDRMQQIAAAMKSLDIAHAAVRGMQH